MAGPTLAEAAVDLVADGSGLKGEVASAAEGAAKQAQAKLNEIGSAFTAAGRTLSFALTAPIVGVGAASFQLARDFESSTTRIVALAGVPREQMNEWEGDVRRLARTFGMSGAEAADALFFIVSAGLEGQAALDALEVSLRASATGLGSVEEVALLATSAIAAYGPEVINAAQAADILAAAAAQAVFAPEELSAALTGVIPLAAEMGVTFDEAAGIMAALAPSVNSASEASTQMSAIMRAMLAPSQQATQILGEFGVTGEDVRRVVEEQGLLDALRFLEDTLEGDTEAMARVLGSSQALQGALGLLGRDADDVDAILAATANSAGMLEGSFDEVSQTADFKLSVAMAEAKDLLLGIGQQVLPIIVDILGSVTGFVGRLANAWENLSPGMQRAIVIGAGLVAALGPLLVIIGMIFSSIASLIPLFSLLISPVTLVIAVIAGLVAAFIWAYNNVEWFRDGVQAVIGTVVSIFQTAFAFISDVVTTVLGAIQAFWAQWGDQIMAVVNAVFGFVVGWITMQINIVRTVITTVVGAIQAFWSRWGDNIMNVIRAAMNFIRTTIQNVMNIIRGIWMAVTGLLRGDWERFGEGIGRIAGAFMNQIRNVINTGLAFIRNLFPIARDAITAIWRSLWERIQETARNMIQRARDAVRDGINNTIDFFRQLPSRITSAISNAPNLLYNIGRQIIQGLIRGITSMVSNAIQAVRNAVSGIVRGAKSALGIGSPSRIFREIGIDVLQGLQLGLEDFTPTIPTPTVGGIDVIGGDGAAIGRRLPLSRVGDGATSNNFGGIKIDIHIDKVASDMDARRAGEMTAEAFLERLASERVGR